MLKVLKYGSETCFSLFRCTKIWHQQEDSLFVAILSTLSLPIIERSNPPTLAYGLNLENIHTESCQCNGEGQPRIQTLTNRLHFVKQLTKNPHY